MKGKNRREKRIWEGKVRIILWQRVWPLGQMSPNSVLFLWHCPGVTTQRQKVLTLWPGEARGDQGTLADGFTRMGSIGGGEVIQSKLWVLIPEGLWVMGMKHQAKMTQHAFLSISELKPNAEKEPDTWRAAWGENRECKTRWLDLPRLTDWTMLWAQTFFFFNSK